MHNNSWTHHFFVTTEPVLEDSSSFFKVCLHFSKDGIVCLHFSRHGSFNWSALCCLARVFLTFKTSLTGWDKRIWDFPADPDGDGVSENLDWSLKLLIWAMCRRLLAPELDVTGFLSSGIFDVEWRRSTTAWGRASPTA